jgi:hypothetical protein
MEAGFRRRCSRPAEHGDHFFPWSKGGASSLQNFVAACARCNRTKGARLPSPGQQARMERRRRAYFTPDGSVSVGERQLLCHQVRFFVQVRQPYGASTACSSGTKARLPAWCARPGPATQPARALCMWSRCSNSTGR